MTAASSLTRAVTDALKAATIPDGDKAAVALVKRYAALLDAARGGEDEVEVFDKLGPKLLAALTALGMTAAGRAARGGGTGGTSGRTPLDELRERRAQRAGQH